MELINKIRKSRKGFTLVEIIVVLVILAILAAFTIPAMLGFVNDAKGKAYIAEAREVYVAAQATATEMIAGNNGTNDITDGGLSTAMGSVEVIKVKTLGATPSKAEIASHQMYKYLETTQGGDLTISTAAITAAASPTGSAAWTVTIGDPKDSTTQAEKTGKVTKLVYVRNGYQVTIEGGNSTVQKWKATT
ncbi:type II secretion system protein [Acetobacterium wieringae]|uniref:Type II secretion system protein n=1 Tax=Acetobacterium wieringae TaxID=52694 RepID=A0A5D0WTF1_9FIRM|nr:type II secretion system protein [Acetobacterium wieringae]TYC87572.1 type II secretion system protein [Acetobacterium wieringae]